MLSSNTVAPLKVADEAFLVASTIERCPKTMMMRELFMNAVEAAMNAPEGQRQIEIRSKSIGGVSKLVLWNTGPGMSSEELYQICDIAASIGKDKGLDGNFGMGAKVASLPSNRLGLRYRSCKAGKVSEVILCERDGTYGRLRRETEPGVFDEVIDVTSALVEEDADLSFDWTEVTLLGNHGDQDTVFDPYDGNPKSNRQWLADYLYYRFFKLPPDLSVRFLADTHKLDGSRPFRTIPDRAFPLGRYETVTTPSGVSVHYFFDPPMANTGHNKSVSGAITSDVSICGLVFKDELYDVNRGRQWTLDAPLFGVPFGAKHISVFVELPLGAAVRPEAYRQFLRYRQGDQRQVEARDFAELVRENRPEWLIEVINSFAPVDSSSPNEIPDELQKLLNNLRVRSPSPREAIDGPLAIEDGGHSGMKIARDGAGPGTGASPKLSLDDLLAVPHGARRAAISLNAERAPDIRLLRDLPQIEDKSLRGKAARFYPDTGQLFINMLYPAFAEMRDQLELEYRSYSDPELVRRLATEASERVVVSRIGRAVVYALAKRLNREWDEADMARAQSPESLSLAADDFADALQNVRRRMGQVLRVGKDGSSEPGNDEVSEERAAAV